MPKDTPTYSQLKIRLPEALKKKIDASAEALKRPLNAEVVQRLESSFVSIRVEQEPFEPLSWLANMKRRIDVAEETRDRGAFQKIRE